MAQYVGQQLGNYRLIQLLGQGNFSGVYLGEHVHLHTQAAIKVLHGQVATHDVEGFPARHVPSLAYDIPISSRCWTLVWRAGLPFW